MTTASPKWLLHVDQVFVRAVLDLIVMFDQAPGYAFVVSGVMVRMKYVRILYQVLIIRRDPCLLR